MNRNYYKESLDFIKNNSIYDPAFEFVKFLQGCWEEFKDNDWIVYCLLAHILWCEFERSVSKFPGIEKSEKKEEAIRIIKLGLWCDEFWLVSTCHQVGKFDKYDYFKYIDSLHKDDKSTHEENQSFEYFISLKRDIHWIMLIKRALDQANDLCKYLMPDARELSKGLWKEKDGKKTSEVLEPKFAGRLKSLSYTTPHLDKYLNTAYEEYSQDILDLYNNIKNGQNIFDAEDSSEIPTLVSNWIIDLLEDENDLLPTQIEYNSVKSYSVTVLPNLKYLDSLKSRMKNNFSYLDFLIKSSNQLKRNKEVGLIENLKHISFKEKTFSKKLWDLHDQDRTLDSIWELHFLRDWGSYTPLLPVNIRDDKVGGGGGGCFLIYYDRGIVIDPGFDFLEHFFASGFDISKITDVIVTHDHYDHCASFGPLLNMLFVYHKTRINQLKESTQLTEDKIRKVNFFLSQGIYSQFARAIISFNYFGEVVPIDENDDKMYRIHRIGKQIELCITPCQHGLPGGFGKGVGLVFKDKTSRAVPTLAITSDTGWSKNLGECIAQHKPGVLVLHVGSFKRTELIDSGFYDTHLGLRGTFNCIDAVKSCRLAVLTEFGEECLRYRAKFSHIVTQYFNANDRPDLRCFPSDRYTVVKADKNNIIKIGGRDLSVIPEYDKAECREDNDRLKFS